MCVHALPGLINEVRKDAASKMLLVRRDISKDAPQVAPVSGKYIRVHHVGLAWPCAAKIQQHIHPLAHQILQLPQEAAYNVGSSSVQVWNKGTYATINISTNQSTNQPNVGCTSASQAGSHCPSRPFASGSHLSRF